MKQIALLVIAVAVMFTVSSCGASKKLAEQGTTAATYVQPGSELISGDGLIRGWGMGKSDSEASAHKKAVINASAALAAALNQTIESTTEEYTAVLSEGNAAASKSLLYDYVKSAVNQVLNGSTIIYDRWADDPKDGQKINYVVMELKGENFLQQLYKEIEKANGNVDKELLNRLFMKHIGQTEKSE